VDGFFLIATGVLIGLGLGMGILVLQSRRPRERPSAPLAEPLEAMAVPPFRISLRPVASPDWNRADSIARCASEFEAVGYRPVGDFEVPELSGVGVRGFWHPKRLCYAALYEHPHAGVVADAVGLFRDRTMLTVSSTPETGLDRPERAPLVRLVLDLEQAGGVQSLHDRLLEASGGRESIQTRPEQFVRAFVGAYAFEQDWRISRGGVTQAEVRRAAALGGLAPPDERTLARVQADWERAISEFVSEALCAAYAAGRALSAARLVRLRAVHERSVASAWIDELARGLIEGHYDEHDEQAEGRAYGAARERIGQAFTTADVCRGFAAAQHLLPEKRRFEKLASLSRPWRGDLYLEPEQWVDV
jgi:hypothetical protein